MQITINLDPSYIILEDDCSSVHTTCTDEEIRKILALLGCNQRTISDCVVRVRMPSDSPVLRAIQGILTCKPTPKKTGNFVLLRNAAQNAASGGHYKEAQEIFQRVLKAVETTSGKDSEEYNACLTEAAVSLRPKWVKEAASG
jgi:hypothetical protein